MIRSGSLRSKNTAQIVKDGFEPSSITDIYGDAGPLTRFAEVPPMFEADSETVVVVIISELGGTLDQHV